MIVICALILVLAGMTHGQASNPDFKNVGYHRPINPFDQWQSDWYECTRYAWGRAYERTGLKLAFSRNTDRHGGKWMDLVTNALKGQEPRNLAIAVFSYGTYGHVAFVEQVDNLYVHISEANWTNKGRYDGVKKLTRDSIKKRGNYTLIGYIYLGGTVPPPPVVTPSVALIYESHPDNTRVAPGQSIITSWRFRANSAVYVWRAVRISGNLSPNAVVYIGQNYQAGQNFDFKLAMKIPTYSCTVKEVWQFQGRDGKPILVGKSQTFWRQLIVR